MLIAGRGRRPSGVTRTRSSRGARKGQGTCESERREPIPEGPKPPHSRLAGSSTFRLRLLVFAPPPTRLLVQPTPHSGGDTPPQSEERRLVAPECSPRHGPGAASGWQVLKRRFKDTGLYFERCLEWPGGWRLEVGRGRILPSPKPPIQAPPPGEGPGTWLVSTSVSLRSLVSLRLPWDFLLDAAWSGDPARERHGLGAQRPSPSGPSRRRGLPRSVLNPLGAKARTSVGSGPGRQRL